jgi:NAD(P)-dependent dehydrogenase (short-subunit alcohol dehydrogenase family)
MTAGHALIIGNTDGIGLALTRKLLALGWTVTGVSRRSPVVEAPGFHGAVSDVAAAGYRAALEALRAARGPFDACVYCVGVGDLLDLAALAGDADVVRVNFVGAVETLAVVVPAMLAAGRGHVIALSSLADGVSAAAPSYAASKAGLSSYLEGLALAVRPRGVAITNLRFGFVDTKMAKSRLRPFMISADAAADVVLGCLRDRPVRRSYPRRMAALVWLLDAVTSIRIWFA